MRNVNLSHTQVGATHEAGGTVKLPTKKGSRWSPIKEILTFHCPQLSTYTLAPLGLLSGNKGNHIGGAVTENSNLAVLALLSSTGDCPYPQMAP